jgi:glycine oxidase
MEERGHDTSVTVGAVHDMLRDAAELLPGVLELEIEETLSGLRPATPDNAPAIGPAAGLDGLLWAAGHHRNGVLLTPVTADLLAGALAGEQPEPGFSPQRFAAAAAPAREVLA